MPTKEKRITVYPGPRVLAVLGETSPALNQALEVWAMQVARATEDNSRTFTATEWGLVADVCNGTLWEPSVESPAAMLATNVIDGHNLDGAGYRWFGEDGTALALKRAGINQDKPNKEMVMVDGKVSALVGKLQQLDAVHAWAMVCAVQWFWSAENVDLKSPWWTLAYRRRHQEKENGTAS